MMGGCLLREWSVSVYGCELLLGLPRCFLSLFSGVVKLIYI